MAAQPRSETVYAGHVARFTARASGTPTPTVRWQDRRGSTGSWKKVKGATARTYSFTASRSENGYEYRAVFANSVGTAISHTARLTVKSVTGTPPRIIPTTSAPVVTGQSASQTVTTGDTAIFHVSASGSPTPSVQWQVSTNGGATWANAADATSTTYSFTASIFDSNDEYRAVFTNSAGSTITTPATLTVTGVTITQTAPTTGSTTTTGSSTFTAQLEPTTENGSPVTYVTTTPNAHLSVSSSGAVSTVSGPLAAGSYPVSGTDSDALGDTGTWSYTLTVTGVTITQTAPTTGSTTTTGSSTFTAQLEPTTENGSPVTYVTTTPNAHLSVSSSGAVSTVSGPLAAGSYPVSGTDSDALGDTGTWSYTLTVTGVTITQTAPTTGSTTTTGSSTFTAQLEPTTENGSPVTYVTTTPNAHLSVSSSGAVSTVSGPLAAGSYPVSGTDSDALGDTGTWSYTLTVTGVTITQTAPTTGSTTTTGSSTFTAQLEPTTENGSPVTYVTTTPNAHLSVSSSGAVSTVSGPLAAGSYPVSGTDSDALGDTGTWSYTLTVDTITQTAPTTGSTTTTGSSTFTAQLEPTTENGSPVTYVTTTPNAHLSVSSSGAVSTVSGPLAAGSYPVSGTDSDALGDTGTWSYTLTVTGVTITQTAPTTGSTTTTGSSTFTAQLEPTTENGSPVTYVTTTPNAHLSVSSSGAVSTVSGPLAAGSYPVSGTDSDALGDTGTWSYTLTVTGVTITQTAPTTGSTTTTGSSTFTAQLEPTTENGSPVTYVTTTPNAHLSVSSSGAVSTVSGPLAAGSYPVSGTDSDALGDTGTWSYTLTVTGVTITQTAPTTGSTTTTGSSTFTAQLEPTTENGSPVTYVTTTPNAHLSVSSSGAVSTVSGPLAAGSYPVSGTDSDALGDTGTWSYTLTVTGVTITQTAPTTGSTTTTGSSTFTAQLEPTTENGSPVTYVTTTPNAHLSVSSSGAVSTVSGPLAAGSYPVSGTDSDALGDTGTWSYTLTVTGVTITQTAPTTGSTTTTGSSTFTAQLEPTTENGSPVTYVTTTPNAHLSVSSSGAVSTVSGPLAAGSYPVSGTDSDALGDTGTWSYTLTVTSPPAVTEQPTNDTATSGDTGDEAKFSAAASGYPTPTVQWQVSSDGGSMWQNVTGATSNTYSFTAWSSENGYEYQAVFTNSLGEATTNPATLTVDPAQDLNWSGYVDVPSPGTTNTFTSVSGDWTVPTVTCTEGESAYSSAWIGIDGYSSSTVEQDGTEADCLGGAASYDAWYEFYAASGSPVGDGYEEELSTTTYPVSPGDAMSASVSVSGTSWTLKISDSTKNWKFTEGPITWAAPQKSSAEWIVERPEICSETCSLTSLADFGSVTFTDATATENGTSGPISAFTYSVMEMLNNNEDTVLAEPGSLDSTGEDFTDDWEATGP